MIVTASDRLRAWWQLRSTRERRMLIALGAVALVALLLVAVVRPLQAARSAALADIRTYQTLTARLRGTAPGPARPAALSGAPATIVATSAAGFGLTPDTAAAAGGAVQATLADAPYDAVLRWIAAVEAGSRLRVSGLTILPGGGPGRVRASILFTP